MTAKLIMRWNIRPEMESDYFEFLVHEFIPALNSLGIVEIQVWYTQYGDCEQKLVSGITPSLEKMQELINSEAYARLIDRLGQYVTHFSQKVVAATAGFQF